MHSVLRLPILGISLVISLFGCQNCGPSAEPLLRLSLESTTPNRLDTLYAPSSRAPLPAQPYSTTALTSSRFLVLPLNLNTDSTQYVFQLSGRRDTVTVFYVRDFLYQNRTCGYVLNLKQPTGSAARVTRGTVGSASYRQNRDATFLSQKSDTEISVTIRL